MNLSPEPPETTEPQGPLFQAPEPSSRPFSPLAALLAGLAAGLLAFTLGELALDFFPPANVPQSLSGAIVMKPTVETIAVADGKNAALAFALLGSSLGFLLGLAGRSVHPASPGRRPWTGPVVGLVLGATLGAVLPLLLVAPANWFQLHYLDDNLIAPLALHAIYWGSLGAVGGLAYGVGSGSPGRGRFVLLGFLGACLGAVIYEVVGATMDPLAGTTEPISRTWGTRLLARELVTLGAGAAIGLASLSSLRASGQGPRT